MMVIDTNETKLDTIAQRQDFLKATPEVRSGGVGEEDGTEIYEHISRVLKRFDDPPRKWAERGVVLAYLPRTSGYSRALIKYLVARWHNNRLAAKPIVKRYWALSAPLQRDLSVGVYMAAALRLGKQPRLGS